MGESPAHFQAYSPVRTGYQGHFSISLCHVLSVSRTESYPRLMLRLVSTVFWMRLLPAFSGL
jgi:hypothetical protein